MGHKTYFSAWELDLSACLLEVGRFAGLVAEAQCRESYGKGVVDTSNSWYVDVCQAWLIVILLLSLTECMQAGHILIVIELELLFQRMMTRIQKTRT